VRREPAGGVVGRAYWDGLDVGFTLVEYNVVHLLSSNAGRLVTYRAIYDRVHYGHAHLGCPNLNHLQPAAIARP
jgi:hypothetical protein